MNRFSPEGVLADSDMNQENTVITCFGDSSWLVSCLAAGPLKASRTALKAARYIFGYTLESPPSIAADYTHMDLMPTNTVRRVGNEYPKRACGGSRQ